MPHFLGRGVRTRSPILPITVRPPSKESFDFHPLLCVTCKEVQNSVCVSRVSKTSINVTCLTLRL